VALSVEAVQAPTAEVLESMHRLVPQLSSHAEPMTKDELQEIAGSKATVLFVARDGEEIVGTLTLVMFRIPSGLRAWIEDVITDESQRGKGVGEALTMAAIDMARSRHVRSIDLTSRPSREAANRLYQRLGFVARDTNVYRFDLTP
jgi:ribosomal protein S18 acetylase RimI-like enzyme